MSLIIQDMHRFDDAARMVLFDAKQEAVRLGHAKIMPEHVLLGVLQQHHPASSLLLEQGLSLKRARASLEELVGRRESAVLEPDLNQASRLCLEAATAEARRLHAEQINPGHLLLGVLRQAETNARQSGATGAIHYMLRELEGGLRGVMRRVLESLRSSQAQVVIAPNAEVVTASNIEVVTAPNAEVVTAPNAEVVTASNTEVTVPKAEVAITITVSLEPAVHQKILEFAFIQGKSLEAASQMILSDWAKR